MPDILEPVANLLLAPPLALMLPNLQPEILTGSGTLPRLSHVQLRLQYGAIFTAFTIPPYLGRTASPRPEFFDPLLELWFVHELGNGNGARTQKWSMHEPTDTVRFFSLELTSIEFSVLPGVEINWSYLMFQAP